MSREKTPDLSEFDAAASPAHRPCEGCIAFNRLDPDRRAKLEAALDAERYSAVAIKRVLDGWGVYVSEEAVRRHRPFGTTAGKKFCVSKYPGGKPT